MNVTIPAGVTSIGDSTFCGCSGLTEVIIPSNVTSIGNYAFQSCTGLTSVTILGSVTSIGYSTFKSCTQLSSVTIQDGVSLIGNGMFEGCTSLSSVYIPGSVASIGDYAFRSCANLTDVSISAGVTSIGWQAFSSCNKLKSIVIPDSVISIGDNAFNSKFYSSSVLRDIYYSGSQEQWNAVQKGSNSILSDVEVHYALVPGDNPEKPDEVKYQVTGGYLHFDKATGTITGCDKSVTEARLPSIIDGTDVLAIGEEAFKDCANLTLLTISKNVKTIGARAFQGCTGLTSVTIPKGVGNIDTISEGLFSGCANLESVTIPASVTSIGADAFGGCTNLTDIYYGGTRVQWNAVQKDGAIPSGVTVHHNSSGNRVPYAVTGGNIYFDPATWAIVDCDGGIGVADIPSVIGNQLVTAIGDEAFKGCDELTRITIPVSVTSIGKYAFADCMSLTSIELSDGIGSIPEGMLSGCSSLENVTIPDNVRTIGASAFSGCEKLKQIVIPNGATTIGEKAFFNCAGLVTAFIPERLKTIGAYAFCNCGALEEIAIPSVATEIKDGTFSGCTSLWYVKIPVNVTHVSQDAFRLTNLSNVDYGGTEDQWKKVTIDSGNEKLKAALLNTWKLFRFANAPEHFFKSEEKREHSAGEYLLALDILVYQKFFDTDYHNSRFNIFNQEGWGGSCYGMASLEGMVNSGIYSVDKIESGKTEIEKVSFPRNNHHVRELVDYYWYSQLLPERPYNDQSNQRRIGTDAGKESLERLKNSVLSGKPCMINYFFPSSDSDDLSGHTFIVEGGRDLGDRGYELIGRDNRYYGFRNPRTGIPRTSTVWISADFSSCQVTTPYVGKGEVRETDGAVCPDTLWTEHEIVHSISVYDNFRQFEALDPESVINSFHLFDVSESQAATTLFYYLPENTDADSLVLQDSAGNDLVRNETAGDGVQYLKYINQGSTLQMVTDADGSTRLERDNAPAGLMAELGTDESVCIVSGIDGTCAYIGLEGMAAVNVGNADTRADIDLMNHAVTLKGNTGEFSITLAMPESDSTVATVTGTTESQAETITVTAEPNGDITLSAPAGTYAVTFEDEDDEEITIPVTVSTSDSGKNVEVKNPTDPIPCDSDAYTAGIEWKGGGAYTVTVTPKTGSAAPTLTAWQACYDTEGKLLSTTGLTRTTANGGVSFSGKVSQEGTCYLFVVDGNTAPIIRKYNLTKHNK